MTIYEGSRWLQRFQNYHRSLSHLDLAMKIVEEKSIDDFSDLENRD